MCGGIPLQPVKTSVILEINRACNTILPAEDGIEPPPRRPGRGAVNSPLNSWTRSEGPGDNTIFFDFDNDFLSLHSTGAVQRIVENFLLTKAKELHLTAYRGSSKLSNGTVMIEKSSIAAERIAKLRDVLVGLGVPLRTIKVQSVNDERPPDGVNDPWSRKATLSVKR